MERLTEGEEKVLELILSGYTTKEIASFLFRSPRCIDSRRKNIREKLDVPGRNNIKLINAARFYFSTFKKCCEVSDMAPLMYAVLKEYLNGGTSAALCGEARRIYKAIEGKDFVPEYRNKKAPITQGAGRKAIKTKPTD